ncbi:putative transcription factor interactor and regulator CCHC(Zn) family [Helianthus anomalus]
MKTCVKCQQVGHVSRKYLQNLKPIDCEKEKNNVEVVKQKLTKVESQQTWKPKTLRFENKQICKSTADLTNPNQFWKPKVDLSKRNI